MTNTGMIVLAIFSGIELLALAAVTVWLVRMRKTNKLNAQNAEVARLIRIMNAVNEGDLTNVAALRSSKWYEFIYELPSPLDVQTRRQYDDALSNASLHEQYGLHFPDVEKAYQEFICSQGTPAARLALLQEYANRLQILLDSNQTRAIRQLKAGNLTKFAQLIIEELLDEHLTAARAGSRDGFADAGQLIADVNKEWHPYSGQRFGWVKQLSKLEYSEDWDILLVGFVVSPALGDFKHSPTIGHNDLLVEYAKAIRDSDIWLAKLLLAHYASDRSAQQIIGERNANQLAMLVLRHATANGLPLASRGN